MPESSDRGDAAGSRGAFVAAVTFLTRLHVSDTSANAAERGRALAFFPAVGLMLGLILATAAWWLAAWLSPALVGVAVVSLLAALTGGLHLDGVADVFDGLSGGHGDRERTLAIMRDSRIGAHGAVAVMLLLIAKVLAVAPIIEHRQLRWLVLFPAVARWTVLPLVVYLPYARETGLGKTLNESGSARDIGWATLWVGVPLVWAGGRGIAGVLLAALVTLLFGWWMQRRLGGMTGDVYGAAIELAEVAFLIAAGAGT